MKRAHLIAAALVCLFLLGPADALATTPHASAANAGIARGAVSWVSQSSLSILQGTRRMPVLSALERSANAVDRADYPYVYGGGHGSAGTASAGRKGPGYTGHTPGYDCSGSVAAVLSGAGLWPAGAPVPADNGVIAELLRARILAPGPGAVTLYDKPGVHIFMNIAGRYFGTSDGLAGNPSQPRHGAGWLFDGAPDARNAAFKRYHILPARLRAITLYGTSLTFRAATGVDLSGFATGDRVSVAYRTGRTGSLIARAVAYADAKSAVGILVSVDAGHSTFTVQSAAGTLTFSDAGGLVSATQLGDRVQVTYTSHASGLVAHAVKDLAPAAVLTASGTIIQIPDDQSSVSIETASGQTLTFATDQSLLDAVSVGDDVQVSYVQAGSLLIARDVEPLDEQMLDATGTITQIAPDQSSFTLHTDGGESLTFQAEPGALDGFEVGDSVDVTYTHAISGPFTAQDVECQ